MKTSVTWQQLKEISKTLSGALVYWIEPGDRKSVLHGKIIESIWDDPLFPIGLESEFGDTWFIRLNPMGEVPCSTIAIDPMCSGIPYLLPNGDIQIPYGVGCYHITLHDSVNGEMAFAI